MSISRFLLSCFSVLLVSMFSLFWPFSNSASPLLVSERRSSDRRSIPSCFSSAFFARCSSLFSVFFSLVSSAFA
uniref:Candidate secreted effector n=1 Tax=Meloidogyne incognita TaxID=6306 RepID=A0A914KI21_MELIC